MIKAKLLDNGNILIPVRAESKDGVIGDSFTEVSPNSKEFRQWIDFLSKEDQDKLDL